MQLQNGIPNSGQVRASLSKLVVQLGEVKDNNALAEDSYKKAYSQNEGVGPEFKGIRGSNSSPLNRLAYDRPGVDQSLEAKRVDAVINIVDAKMSDSGKTFAQANAQAQSGGSMLQQVLTSATELRPAFTSNPMLLKDFDEALHQLGTASYCQREAVKGQNEAAELKSEYDQAFLAIQAPLGLLKADTADNDSTAAGQLTYSAAFKMDKRSEDFHFKLNSPAGSLHCERPYLEQAQKLLSGLLGNI